jgi:hypothetical protein
MPVIGLIVVALVAFALLWRWTTPSNALPQTPDDYRAEHGDNGDPIAAQSRQESDAQIAPWIGGNG